MHDDIIYINKFKDLTIKKREREKKLEASIIIN